MVLLMLKIKADLENLTNLNPTGGSDGSEFTFYFKVKCGGCGSISEKDSTVTASEQYPIPKSRGTAHLVQKCKLCDSVGNISLIEGRGKPYTSEDSEAGKFVPVACFDCRGMEPATFSLRDGWSAEGLSGTKFENIDLTDGEWSEYDERASASVGILNIEHTFDVTK
ncbi:hypothetical protein Mapa_002208 [Marchantia paleacea]|nr:hypothetical protein Mapa_002208 [Marchantia paleacea]